jgi:hypothetical protein
MLFCLEVCGQVSLWNILCAVKKNLNWLEVNSSSLSIYICFINVEKTFSAMVLNLTKVSNTSAFLCNG